MIQIFLTMIILFTRKRSWSRGMGQTPLITGGQILKVDLMNP
jgi:hypothetical protein